MRLLSITRPAIESARTFHSAVGSIARQLPQGAVGEGSATIILGAGIAQTLLDLVKIFSAAKRDPALYADLCGYPLHAVQEDAMISPSVLALAMASPLV